MESRKSKSIPPWQFFQEYARSWLTFALCSATEEGRLRSHLLTRVVDIWCISTKFFEKFLYSSGFLWTIKDSPKLMNQLMNLVGYYKRRRVRFSQHNSLMCPIVSHYADLQAWCHLSGNDINHSEGHRWRCGSQKLSCAMGEQEITRFSLARVKGWYLSFVVLQYKIEFSWKRWKL